MLLGLVEHAVQSQLLYHVVALQELDGHSGLADDAVHAVDLAVHRIRKCGDVLDEARAQNIQLWFYDRCKHEPLLHGYVLARETVVAAEV